MELREARPTIEEMYRSGASFEEIETKIDELEDLTSDQRSALWLYAFSLMERGRQKYVVRQALMLNGDGGDPVPVGTD